MGLAVVGRHADAGILGSDVPEKVEAFQMDLGGLRCFFAIGLNSMQFV